MRELTQDELSSGVLRQELLQFTGSALRFRHGAMPGFGYTEGVRYLAERVQAYWLIDAIFAHQLNPRVAVHPFQVWTLTHTGTSSWRLYNDDGNGRLAGGAQSATWEQFPMPDVLLYLVDHTLMLPGEPSDEVRSRDFRFREGKLWLKVDRKGRRS